MRPTTVTAVRGNSAEQCRPTPGTVARGSWQWWPYGSWANAAPTIGYNPLSYQAAQLGGGSSPQALIPSRPWPNARVSARARRREHTLLEKHKWPIVLSTCLPALHIRMLRKPQSGAPRHDVAAHRAQQNSAKRDVVQEASSPGQRAAG